MNEVKRPIRIIFEMGICIINGGLFLGFWVANANYATSGFVKPGLAVFAEIGFAFGIAAVVGLVVSRISLKTFYVRSVLLMLATLWKSFAL